MTAVAAVVHVSVIHAGEVQVRGQSLSIYSIKANGQPVTVYTRTSTSKIRNNKEKRTGSPLHINTVVSCWSSARRLTSESKPHLMHMQTEQTPVHWSPNCLKRAQNAVTQHALTCTSPSFHHLRKRSGILHPCMRAYNSNLASIPHDRKHPRRRNGERNGNGERDNGHSDEHHLHRTRDNDRDRNGDHSNDHWQHRRSRRDARRAILREDT